MAQDIASLLGAADEAAGAGREAHARKLWQDVLALEPGHPRALFRLGERALMDGRPEIARDLFMRAAGAKPDEPSIPFHTSLAFRALGNPVSEMAALDRALAISPNFLVALLAKGDLLERTGSPRRAARVYARALDVAAYAENIPPQLKPALLHARRSVEANADALASFLLERTEGTRSRHAGARFSRFDESLQILSGRQKNYVSHCEILQFPQLPGIGYYDREAFDWLRRLEAATEEIRNELARVLADDASRKDFGPYVKLPKNEPLNQWADLNFSLDWTAFYLWQDGAKVGDHCVRCPKTVALLESMPQAIIPGFGPTAFFSALAPHTHLPAHTGSTNVRLTVHLPLIVPGQCRFRVGNETRDWRVGEAWVFDDTIEHEAWNDSDQVRTILIFDIWNPHLSAAERELVASMLSAYQGYYIA